MRTSHWQRRYDRALRILDKKIISIESRALMKEIFDEVELLLPISFVFGFFSRMRCVAFPRASDWRARVKSFCGMSVSLAISSYVNLSLVLNSINIHIWWVDKEIMWRRGWAFLGGIIMGIIALEVLGPPPVEVDTALLSIIGIAEKEGWLIEEFCVRSCEASSFRWPKKTALRSAQPSWGWRVSWRPLCLPR